MGNVVDYIRWRGDLSFEQSPFCEVDNLILSYLAYVNLDGISTIAGENSDTIERVSGKFFELHTEEELEKDKSFIHDAPYMMREMASAPRFSNLRVKNYINKVDASIQVQFSAVEIMLDDHVSYIAYRGTDDTIVGWKEDFNLSNGIVPAQTMSVDYLNRVAEGRENSLIVGGHSKGGNLAIYASAKCESAVQDRIQRVYDNDGPGFWKDFFEKPGFAKIEDKIVRIIPECSVIGMLLDHTAQSIYVESSQKGILQHDGLSWEIMGSAFVRKDGLDKKAELFDVTLRGWIDGMEVKEREETIDDFFSVLEASGATTLTELQNGGLKSLTAMLKQMEALKPETKQVTESLVKSLFAHWTEFI